MTPHIKAKKGEFAPTVLMPGDPLRAKWIADNFLKDVKQVNEVRGMLGFTGTYKGKEVSVMGHGMGIPSIGIYSYELFKFYDVKNIIRVGSAGAYAPSLKLGDVVIGHQSWSESTYPQQLGLVDPGLVLDATPALVDHFVKTAEQHKIKFVKGRVHAEDCFYAKLTAEQRAAKSGAICVEMEATGLYANARVLNKNALVLLTISDSLVTHESMSPEQRQTSFKEMITLALEAAITL